MSFFLRYAIVGLWAIVNNAGVDFLGDVELSSMETYRRVMEVNLFGMIRVTKAFLPLIRASKGKLYRYRVSHN